MSQTFLFSAFSTALARIAASPTTASIQAGGAPTTHTLRSFAFAMPVLGMLLALLVFWAVVASHRCITALRAHLQALEMRIPPDFHDNLAISLLNSSRTRIAGFLPFALPALLFLAWCYLLLVHALA